MGEIILANSLLEVAVLGKGLKSPLQTDSGTGDFVRVDGSENVKMCILDLITTRIGERLMNEDIGTLTMDSLFESQQAVVDIVPHQIVDAIRRYETRVTRVSARGIPVGKDTVDINVEWVLRSSGRADGTVYPYYLNSNREGFGNAR